MGTNYYLHLGKRSVLAKGKGCVYHVAATCDLPIPRHPTASVIEDEYGKRYTLLEFSELVMHDELDYSSLWEEFS